MALHWHRRDLRPADNRGLAAASTGPVVPAFVLDPAVLQHASPPRVTFLLDALSSLRTWYRDRGSDLLVVRGDPREVLPALAAEHGAEAVTWGRDHSGLARRRDAAVREALESAGVEARPVADLLLQEPGTITNAEGDPYSVFSYFEAKWREREVEAPAPTPDAAALEPVDGEPIPTRADLGFEAPEADVPRAGLDAARERLSSFCESDIYRYGDGRDYPAEDCTSRLSPHLAFGTVGVREVYDATEEALLAASSPEARESVREFRRQLAWRDFYAHWLRFNPGVVAEDYRKFEHPVEWREDPEGLRAWKDGRTGFPLVDAGMRQLRAEAFVHNRVRMVVASFLTKDLLIDWREGYAWFREKLVDHDTANDVGGWQWAASTGTDAQPYFRVFNPSRQAERFDPEATYVRRYVPELGDVPAGTVHRWPDLPEEEREQLAPDYPSPILDHAAARERAIAAFERARGGG